VITEDNFLMEIGWKFILMAAETKL